VRNFTREFVAKRDRRGAGKLALAEMAVGAADTGGKTADADFSGAGMRVGQLGQFDPAHCLQPDRPHLRLMP
jgi:hypothetical protein